MVLVIRVSLLSSVLVVNFLLPRLARAETLYVSPSGSDSNAGSESAPFATLTRAQTSASPGDTVLVRGGHYTFVSDTVVNGVLLDKSGQAGKPIEYRAYPNELPVLDFSGLTAKQRLTGIRVTASYVQVKGLELKGVFQRINTENESWGVYNTGSHNIYESLHIHDIQGPGLFIAQGSDNQVLQCDSYNNYDPMSKAGPGENADGFGCHSSGGNNVFRGCRAWWNSDDGYDFISAKGTCLVEYSWAFWNGFLPNSQTPSGNGNGFKAGGYGTGTVPDSPPRHTVRFCVAVGNRAAGFYANHHPIGGDWFDNSAYQNARDFDMLLLAPGGIANHVLHNNLSYGSKSPLANYTGGDDSFNSWKLSVTVSDADFEGLDLEDLQSPRKNDGSLPDVPLLHLKSDSDLIDKGTDIGFAFQGAAPDLGAFELGSVYHAEPDAEGDAGAGAAAPSSSDAGATPAARDASAATQPSSSKPDASVQTSSGTARSDAGAQSADASPPREGPEQDPNASGVGSVPHHGGCTLGRSPSSETALAPLALLLAGVVLRRPKTLRRA